MSRKFSKIHYSRTAYYEFDFYENRNYELSQKITKIVKNILQKNSDNERYLQNAQKQAISKTGGTKGSIPVVKGLTNPKSLSNDRAFPRSNIFRLRS